MTLLKDLLALRQESETPVDETPINEALGHSLMDKWIDANKAYSWEGSRGRRNLEKLVKDLGYGDFDSFLDDNSGAMEALVEWITNANVPEWKHEMLSKYGDEHDGSDE